PSTGGPDRPLAQPGGTGGVAAPVPPGELPIRSRGTRSRPSCEGPAPRRALCFRSLRCVGPGAVAEWLRSGLQSRLHRFDSGRRLSGPKGDRVVQFGESSLKFVGRSGNLRGLVLGFGGVLRLATRVLEPSKAERRQ